MKPTTTMIPVGALVIALSAVGLSAEAGQRDRQGRDRNGRQSEGQTRDRQSGSGDRGSERSNRESQDRPAVRGDAGVNRGAPGASAAPDRGTRQAEAAPNRGGSRPDANVDRARPGAGPERGVGRPRPDATPNRGGQFGVPDRRDADRGRGDLRGGVATERRYDTRRDDNRWRDDRRIGPSGGRDAYRDNGYRAYGGPRLVVPVRPFPHYYGSGGRYSAYFGLGNGYLFGSPYSGRVYGNLAPRAYGSRIYYGDVRLMVQPRDAEVYVDGYYAGVVDDFDGVFQRLTIEVGAHQIEIAARGLESQFYDVYVDPSQTTTIRTELYR
ncbi:MAG: hypothetical protein ABMA15_14050 [Vicinamibacterales bacterium]